MLEYIYEWIGNIAFYMIMVTAVLHLLPNSDYQKYIRFFTGLVLVIFLATPILKIFGMEKDLANLYDSRAYQEQMKKIEESSEFLNNIAPIEETAGEPQDADGGDLISCGDGGNGIHSQFLSFAGCRRRGIFFCSRASEINRFGIWIPRLPAPDPGTFLYAQKGTKKAPGSPRTPL